MNSLVSSFSLILYTLYEDLIDQMRKNVAWRFFFSRAQTSARHAVSKFFEKATIAQSTGIMQVVHYKVGKINFEIATKRGAVTAYKQDKSTGLKNVLDSEIVCNDNVFNSLKNDIDIF